MAGNWHLSNDTFRVTCCSKIKNLSYNSGSKTATLVLPYSIPPCTKVALEYLAYTGLKSDSTLHFMLNGVRPSFVNKTPLPVIHTWTPRAATQWEEWAPKNVYKLDQHLGNKVEVWIRDTKPVDLDGDLLLIYQLAFS